MDISPAAHRAGSPSVQNCALCDRPLFSEWQIAVVEPCKHQFHAKCVMVRAAGDSLKNINPICPIDNRPLIRLSFDTSFETVQREIPHSTLDESATGAGQGQVLGMPGRAECTAIESSPANTPLRRSIRSGLLDISRELIKNDAITTDTLRAMMNDFLAEDDRRGYRSCLELVAERGDADAQKKMGRMYQKGKYGVSNDDVKARYWFEQAANNGNCRAMVQLAYMVAFGQGGARDYPRVIRLMEQGAKLEDPSCLYVLGGMCFTAWNTPEDHPRARTLLERAVTLGEGKALGLLTQMMFKGLGGPVKSEEAFTLIYEKSKKGDSYGQLVMGDQFFSGNKVPQDFRDAENWYEKSARQGNPDAKVSLAVLRRNENPQQADNLLREVLAGCVERKSELVKTRIKLMFDLIVPPVGQGGAGSYDDWSKRLGTHLDAVDRVVAAITLASTLPSIGVKRKATDT